MQTDGRDRSGKTPQEDDGGEKWQEKKKTTSLSVKRRMKKLPKVNYFFQFSLSQLDLCRSQSLLAVLSECSIMISWTQQK